MQYIAEPITRIESPNRKNCKMIKKGFLGTIGATPLIQLEKLSAATGCNILVKAEFLNPGGSVKDRAALFVVQESEKQGQLKPGGTVVEGTAGNTGIGLAHVCAAKGIVKYYIKTLS